MEGDVKKIFSEFGKIVKDNPDNIDRVISKFFKAVSEIKPYFEKKKYAKDTNELRYLYELYLDFGYGEAAVWVIPLIEILPNEIKARALLAREQTQHLTSLRDELFDYNLSKLFPELKEFTHFVLPQSVFEGKTIDELLKEAIKYKKGFIYFDGKFYTGQQETILKNLNICLSDRVPREKISLIKGQSASTEIVVGKVKIVLTKNDLHKISKGDVLVSPMTRPDFLMAMDKSVAFVTDEGGITCHAAIVARELRKPCIVGTQIATQVLHDGDEVEVDADNGIVRILKNEFN